MAISVLCIKPFILALSHQWFGLKFFARSSKRSECSTEVLGWNWMLCWQWVTFSLKNEIWAWFNLCVWSIPANADYQIWATKKLPWSKVVELYKLDNCARSTSPARRLEYPLSRFALGDGASHHTYFRNSSSRHMHASYDIVSRHDQYPPSWIEFSRIFFRAN